MMQLRAQQKGLELELDPASDFPNHIRGDESRLRQILVNLVSNSVKFTNKGNISIHLSVNKQTPKHLLEIEVKDTGPGISAEDLQRVFHPFVQLSGDSQQSGTGLGLSIVKQYVELMNGRIKVESEPGQGALFHVELPLHEADIGETRPPTGNGFRQAIGLAPGQPSYRILIAEDQRDNQLLLSKLMNKIGMKVAFADNGEECIEKFKEWQPDLIWMDRRMPVIDGLEATRRIRQLSGGNKVKIVAVTASALQEQQEDISIAGMDDKIMKPYRANEIFDCMERLLGLKLHYSDEKNLEGTESASLTPAMLAEIGSELKTALRESVDSLDNRRINEVINLIGEKNHSLAQTLKILADNYDYPAILQALDGPKSTAGD
jgi:CheY-like chemotaxis protein/anti-sigma regulatory factor (Ser/Thr protein kinase)